MNEVSLAKEPSLRKRLKVMRQIMGFSSYDQMFSWILDCLESSQIPKVQRISTECEKGFRATCWHCSEEFVKIKQCPLCLLYVCPHCQKCGCDLSDEGRHVVYLTIKTLTGVDLEKCVSI